MGRLDDAAKRKVVELRKAGLSFRKIKAVLELENIKVSAQAIYLFLREFQGRLPGRVRPPEGPGTGSSTTTPTQALTTARAGGAMREGWSNVQLQNLLREASHHAGLAAAAEFTKQTATAPESLATPSGSGESSGASRQTEANKDENDIQIVSVTSLARGSQQRALQSTAVGAGGPGSATATASAAFMRRRVTPSPATNPILAARKRLLDKALSHRSKSFQQVASLLRRDQSNIPGADLRSAIPRQPETYDLTTEKTTIEEQPGASGGPRRFLTQRPGPTVRSPLPAPRIGIRLPNRTSSPQTSQGPGSPLLIRLQAPSGGQCPPTRRDGNPSPQQAAVQETGGRAAVAQGLQDQIQALGSEVRSLGLALKVLVEQQCRVEREQAQQTQVQKQILSTLQSLASKLGPCCHGQKHNTTPSPPSLPSLSNPSMSTSLAQDTYNYSQGTSYTPCSQAPPSYNPIDSLETVGSFKAAGMNAFPSCNNNNPVSLPPLSHAPTQTQPYAAAYAQQQQHGQALMPSYTQSYASTYGQAHSQPFVASENKTPDYSGGHQDCNVSTQPPGLNSNHSPQDHQLNIIKVE